jgi:transcriptional regulator with XRE-family HTH domain
MPETAVMDLGARVIELRKSRGLSLRQLAQKTGLPLSTLSRVQKDQATLSYLQLIKLAKGLEIELAELFVSRAVDIKSGRRAVTLKGQGLKEVTERYQFELLCGDLANKRMVPGIIDITARTLEEAGGLIRHEGEEFIFVLNGTIDVHTEDYRPTRLTEGDCMYIDSTSGHAYVNVGDAPAKIIAVTTHLLDEYKHL